MLEAVDQSKAPLLGVILCCTSIKTEQRDELSKWALEMGAAHKLDLTSDVTHLVIGHVDTPKYRYVAKERPDIQIVTTAWIGAVREQWLEGGDVDVEKLVDVHRAPTFFGLRICVTGFEEVEQRKEIENRVTSNGAIYSGDLTKNVTHLVALAPKGSKYEHALLWGIKVVALEWIIDSQERGMVLDEALYSLRLPTPQRGKGAWKRLQPETIPLGKRLRGEDDGEGRRKLRRTASSKLNSQSSAIWDELRGGSFVAKQDLDDDSWHENPQSDGIESRVIPALSETSITKPAASRPLGPFDGTSIYIHGFDKVKTELLAEHLHRNGAVIMDILERVDSGFLITPSEMTHDQIDASVRAQDLTKVNEWWVEKCLHKKSLVDPANEFICRPFPHIPVSGFENLFITFTSYADYDRLHFAKLIKLMGATYEEYLSEKVSVMICPTTPNSKPKVAFCSEHSIPVVSPSWMWSCIEHGEVQPFDEHVLEAPRERGDSQYSQPQRSSANATDRMKKERFKREKHAGKLALTTVPKSPPRHDLPKQNLKLRTTDNRKPIRQRRPAMPFSQSSTEDEGAENPCLATISDDDPAPFPSVDGPGSPRPLQELSPSRANAARKPPHAESALLVSTRPSHDQEDASDPGPKSRPTTPTDPPQATNSSATVTATGGHECPPENPPCNKPSTQENLNSAIAALLAQKQQRPISAGSNTSSMGDPAAAAAGAGSSRSRQSRRRQLGRAPSIRSDGGTADAAGQRAGSVAPSTSLSVSGSASGAGRADASASAEVAAEAAVAADREDDSADSQAAALRAQQWSDVPGASQTLLWGAGEGDPERAALIRSLGGRVDEDALLDSKRGGAGAQPQRLTDAGFVGEGSYQGIGSRLGRTRSAAAARGMGRRW
ncbi:BRCT domain-containing protein [Phyllosticta capitalensis]|uniref:BRCT domain-containing protein n=1 Tax=Phyllosticta capitalensis TaxID=121624 RepID=A0ABR1YKM0_9PEZI